MFNFELLQIVDCFYIYNFYTTYSCTRSRINESRVYRGVILSHNVYEFIITSEIERVYTISDRQHCPSIGNLSNQ